MFGHTTSTRPMPFHSTSMAIILISLGRCILYTSHCLVSPRYYSTSSGSMRFSFFGNLNDYYPEFHGIKISFQNNNCDHVLIHVHMFRKISHSLHGMVWIQLNETSDFSSKAHYFPQQKENMISIQSNL